MAALLGTSSFTNYPEEILNLPMFHQISKTKAESIVRQYCHGEGTYLLRPSSDRDENCFAITLSVSPQGNIRHLKVNIEKKKVDGKLKLAYFITSTRKFPTFLDFLKYYYKNSINCDQHINVRLLRGLGYTITESRASGRRLSEPKAPPHSGPVENGKGAPSSQDPHSSSFHHLQHRHSEPHIHSATRSPSGSLVKRSQSGAKAAPPDSASPGGSSYTNHKVLSRRMLQDPKHWPPAPIPQKEESTYVPTYFEVDQNKNFFEETYNLLKETELCECGLRVVDSSLPLGWTIHKFDEPAVGRNIFFQQGEHLTSWDMPPDIVPLLSDVQVVFILQLCQKMGCSVPSCLTNVTAQDQSNNSRTGRGSSSSSHSGTQVQRNFPRESPPSTRSSLASSSSHAETPFLDSPYETPSPLVTSQSVFFPTSSPSQAPSLPRVHEDPSCQDAGNDGTDQGRGYYTRHDHCSAQSDVGSSAEGSFPSASRRPSFNSIPAVTFQALSGAPSAAPRNKSLRQS
ncbi:hypothetical protein EGW08_008188 [Elysia chlorotica]|uniref:SH2 domain-containing protein n=1 Tax=Elysia chlorotica TaxID=188477 RepID=A0A3S1BM54_ELYCH|nr:hypothetical protein EGW08_008188 [Elysia chlorotica]